MAREIPAEHATTLRLAAADASKTLVTAADDIAGIDISLKLGEVLTLVDDYGSLLPGQRAIIEFDTSGSGIATPINRSSPEFVGYGRPAGGAREFVIPNAGISQSRNVTVRIIK